MAAGANVRGRLLLLRERIRGTLLLLRETDDDWTNPGMAHEAFEAFGLWHYTDEVICDRIGNAGGPWLEKLAKSLSPVELVRFIY